MIILKDCSASQEFPWTFLKFKVICYIVYRCTYSGYVVIPSLLPLVSFLGQSGNDTVFPTSLLMQPQVVATLCRMFH